MDPEHWWAKLESENLYLEPTWSRKTCILSQIGVGKLVSWAKLESKTCILSQIGVGNIVTWVKLESENFYPETKRNEMLTLGQPLLIKSLQEMFKSTIYRYVCTVHWDRDSMEYFCHKNIQGLTGGEGEGGMHNAQNNFFSKCKYFWQNTVVFAEC